MRTTTTSASVKIIRWRSSGILKQLRRAWSMARQVSVCLRLQEGELTPRRLERSFGRTTGRMHFQGQILGLEFSAT